MTRRRLTVERARERVPSLRDELAEVNRLRAVLLDEREDVIRALVAAGDTKASIARAFGMRSAMQVNQTLEHPRRRATGRAS